ncbi:MAG: glycosyltransferase family 4 protein [Achromobacter sp.]|uniref:glycosyltransferase family 4 protein n=1 Tax=Achromobacter sp. TaxID=134375 RepID=UPI003D017EA0
MRILHTLGEKSLGGLEFRTLEQAGWLARHGHDAAIAAPAGSAINQAARQRGLVTVDIDFDSPYSPRTLLRLRRAVRRLHIDVIDSHSRADAKAGALCRDLCAVVRTRHFAKPMPTSLRRRLEWKLGCDQVIATSAAGRDALVDAGLAPASRISVVGEWAGDEFFRAADKAGVRRQVRRELALDPRDYVISTIGMLRPEKRQADLLRVVLRLRRQAVPATALVVGMATATTQSYADELRTLAARLGIAEHVVFAGHRTDVADMIHACDVVLVPSATEAWSRVVPESFAARCPVVASNVGGLPEIVRPGATGWLAEPGDIDGFVDRIMRIRDDPAATAAAVARARAHAESHFRLAGQMQRTLDVYARARARD